MCGRHFVVGIEKRVLLRQRLLISSSLKQQLFNEVHAIADLEAIAALG